MFDFSIRSALVFDSSIPALGSGVGSRTWLWCLLVLLNQEVLLFAGNDCSIRLLLGVGGSAFV